MSSMYDTDYSSSSEDEEWEQQCEEAVMEQMYDNESQHLMSKLTELDVGYNPLKGHADGYDHLKWLDAPYTLKDVIKNGKLQHSRHSKIEYMTANRLENFLEAAKYYVHHHRRKVPGTITMQYINSVAASMIHWQYNL